MQWNMAKALCAGVLASSALALAAQDNSTDQIVYTHERGEVVQVAQPTATPVATPSGQPTAVIAQPVATPVSGGLTPEQASALYLPRGPRPGVYQIRAQHSGYCLGAVLRIHGFGLVETSGRQIRCRQPHWDDESVKSVEFYALPHPISGYTIRTLAKIEANGRQAVAGQLSNCATIQRGAVVGPAVIDFRGCGLPSGSSEWLQAGERDQRFFLVPTGNNIFEVRIALDTGDNSDCWAIAGASMDIVANLIRWGCNGNSDQRFGFEWLRPIPAGLEEQLLSKMSWYPTADGHRRIKGADGVDLQGPVFNRFETADDKGDYCMKRCAETESCKAWTWTGRGYVGNDPPICYWKSEPGNAINRGPSALGKLFSGIVRP